MPEKTRRPWPTLGMKGLVVVIAVGLALLATSGVRYAVPFVLTYISRLAPSAAARPLGFFDKSGKVVIDLDPDHPGTHGALSPGPIEDIQDFSCGMARIQFQYPSPPGFIDRSGKLIIVKQADQLWDYSEDLAAFKTARGQLWGFVDLHGETAIEPIYSAAGFFHDGLALVKKNGVGFYINKMGEQVKEPHFDGLYRTKVKDKYGCTDSSGKFVIPPRFDKIYPSSCGIVVAIIGHADLDCDEKNGSIKTDLFYFDLAGKLLFSRPYSFEKFHFLSHVDDNRLAFTVEINAREHSKIVFPDGHRASINMGPFHSLFMDNNPSFHDDLAIAHVGTKYGYMDKQGKIVIPAFYDYAFPFSEGMALIYRDVDGGRLAYIDRFGHQVTPFKFKDAMPFSECLAAVDEGGSYPFYRNVGYIDKTGKYAIPPDPKYSFYSVHEGLAQMRRFSR